MDQSLEDFIGFSIEPSHYLNSLLLCHWGLVYSGLQRSCKDKLPPPPPLLKRKREYLLCSSGKCVLTDKSHKKFRHLPCLRRPVPIEHCIELVNINLDYHWLKIFILNKCCELLCPLQIFWPVVIVQSIPLILPILLKWKIKNFPFQVLCAINLRSTEMAQTCFSCLYRRLQETMRARMHRTLNRLNGLSSWWNNPVVVKNYVFVDILYFLTFWFLYLYPA